MVNNLEVSGALEISDISEHSETKDDWTWDNHDGDVTPTKLLQTPSFKSATAKKVEKEERWKIAIEKRKVQSNKRAASSPPEMKPRGKSTSGIPRLELSSQQ